MSMNMFDFATYFDFTRINDADYLKEKFIKKYQKIIMLFLNMTKML